MSTSYAVRDGLTGPVQPVGSTAAADLHTIPQDLAAPAANAATPASQTRVFAHRGASGLFPEHTRAAYMRALAEGADGLEIDLHLTRDGELVCFHDATLERTSDGAGSVSDVTLEHMRRLDIASWKTPQLPSEYGQKDQQLMTLQDVLELLISAERDVGLAIELKHPSPFGHRLEDRALKILLSYGWDPETSRIPSGQHSVEVSFMSFFSGSLLHLAEMVPAENLCALFTTVTEEAVDKRLGRRRFSTAVKPVVSAAMRRSVRDSKALVWKGQIGMAGPGVDYVHKHRDEAKAWLARGSRLRVWTVDADEDLSMLLNLGVQEITTNYPSKILSRISA